MPEPKARSPADVKALLYAKYMLLTGANGRLGQKLANQFAAEGAHLVLLGRNMPALSLLSKQLNKKYNTHCIAYALDLRRDSLAVYKKLALYLEKNIPCLDAVILNAAYAGTRSNLLTYPLLLWKDVMQINLHANFMLSKTLIPLLMNSSSPLLVFTLANAKDYRSESLGAYAPAKAGLRSLMEILAKEFANSHLLVLGLEPGTIKDGALKNDATGETTALSPTELARLYAITIANARRHHHGHIIRLR